MSRFLTHYSPEGDAGASGAGVGGENASTGSTGGTSTLLAGSNGSAGTSTGTAGTNTGQGATGQGAPVVPDPFFKDWIGSDGKINAAAYDRLPDRLKPFADTFKKYGSVEDLLNGFGHSSTLNGKKGLMPLPKDAPENVKAEFNARLREILQVPDKPEGYGIEKPKDLPDQLWDGEYVNGVKSIFHKYNVSPEAAKALIEYGAGYGNQKFSDMQAQQVKALEDGRRELETKWGSETPKKLALAERVARTVGLDPNDTTLFTSPKVVQAMVKFGEMVSEDRWVSAGSPGLQASTARQQAKDIVQNTANPLHKAYHAGDAAALAKVEELNRLAVQQGGS